MVDPFDQSKTDFVLWMTIGGNALPMGFNQFGTLPIRLQSLPFQTVFPAFEKRACASFGAIVPELSEAFLEDIGRIQTPVGLEQFFSARLPSRLRFSRRESSV